MKLPVGFILFFVASSLWACVSVKPIPNLIYPRPIYPISRYPMASESAGMKAAIYPFAPGRDVYTDPEKPAEREGGLSLNVLDAGVMPVRIIGCFLLIAGDGKQSSTRFRKSPRLPADFKNPL